MTLDDRVDALASLGLTPRQTHFIALVAEAARMAARRERAARRSIRIISRRSYDPG